MSVKFPFFGGGVLGGGECRFYFYGRADFSDFSPPIPGGVAPKFGSEKVSHEGVAGTVAGVALHCATKLSG